MLIIAVELFNVQLLIWLSSAIFAQTVLHVGPTGYQQVNVQYVATAHIWGSPHVGCLAV